MTQLFLAVVDLWKCSIEDHFRAGIILSTQGQTEWTGEETFIVNIILESDSDGQSSFMGIPGFKFSDFHCFLQLLLMT